MRICVRCKVDKSDSDFSSKAIKNGDHRCKVCVVECVRVWRKKNPEKYRVSIKRNNCQRRDSPARMAVNRHCSLSRSHAIRRASYEALGGSCVCCGETQQYFLEIDHIEGGGQRHRKHLMMLKHGRTSYVYALRLEILSGRTDGLQLLCSNCNRGKMRNGGACPHEIERRLEGRGCA